MMARYFIHLRDGTDEVLDDEGVDYPNMDAVKMAVLAGARDLIASEIKSTGLLDLRYRLDAESEAGEIVYTLHFAHAVSIIPAKDSPA